MAKFNRGGLEGSRLGPCSADAGVLPNLTTGGKCLSFFCLLKHQESRQVWIVTPEMFCVPTP